MMFCFLVEDKIRKFIKYDLWSLYRTTHYLHQKQQLYLNKFRLKLSFVLLLVVLGPITFHIGCINHPYIFMEQQATKRGRPRLPVTADVVERRKSSKRLQNAKRGCIQGMCTAIPVFWN